MNKVLLTGRLTRDPEMRSLASGKNVTTVNVLVDATFPSAPAAAQHETASRHLFATIDLLADSKERIMGFVDIETTVAEALNQTRSGLTHDRVVEVFHSFDDEQRTALQGVVFGTITWSADLGRPDAANLWAGFEVKHEFYSLNVVATQDGIFVDKGFVDAQDVGLWDGKAPDGRFQVGFVANFHSLPPNRFSVSLVRIHWRDAAPRNLVVRAIRPNTLLVAQPTGITFLQFEVVGIPLLDIERAGILSEG